MQKRKVRAKKWVLWLRLIALAIKMASFIFPQWKDELAIAAKTIYLLAQVLQVVFVRH